MNGCSFAVAPAHGVAVARAERLAGRGDAMAHDRAGAGP